MPVSRPVKQMGAAGPRHKPSGAASTAPAALEPLGVLISKRLLVAPGLGRCVRASSGRPGGAALAVVRELLITEAPPRRAGALGAHQ